MNRVWLRRLWVIVITITFFGIQSASSVLAACSIGGQVYRDYNANGQIGDREPGIPGVQVTAFGINNTIIATTTTDADGLYTLNINDPAVTQVRVEFSSFPNIFLSGPYGAASTTSVTFVDCNTGAGVFVPPVNFGLNNPGQYCHSDLMLVNNCYVLGDQFSVDNATRNVLVSFPYTAGTINSLIEAAYAVPAETPELLAPQLGTTWGMAHHRSTDTLFLAPFIKRHMGLGPGGTRTIYMLPHVNNPAVSTVGTFVNVDTIFGANTAGADPRTAVTDYLSDVDAYDAVGKVGWGDLDISDDDSLLFAVNLSDRNLYMFPIESPALPNGQPTLGANSRRRPIPSPCGANGRPFGLKYRDNLLYVGVICTAESTPQLISDLTAHVYSFNPATNTFSGFPVLSFPLDYPRTCTNGSPTPCVGFGVTAGEARWLPWRSDFPFAATTTGNRIISWPQPILADIEFDNDDMIIGLRDRFADQMGDLDARGIFWNGTTNTALFRVRGAGDVLRACPNGAGGWDLENGASCGGITTSGNDPSAPAEFGLQGPGNGEYYFGDTFPSSHSELALGGLAQIPGLPDVTVSVFDPIPLASAVFDSGVRWLNNASPGTVNPSPLNVGVVPQTRAGNLTRAYRLIDTTNNASQPGTAGKANGLGDLEGLCGPAPLEIGNRVWEDLDRNGLQDPGETVFPGVIMSLYMDTNNDGVVDTLVATTITDAAGEYIFSEATISAYLGATPPTANIHFWDINGNGTRQPNEPFGILPFTTYEVRIEDPANFAGPLLNYYATIPNAQAVLRDSNGIVPDPAALAGPANVPMTRLTTNGFGANNHTFDFGFSLVPPPSVVPPPIPPGVLPPGTGPSTRGRLVINKQVTPPFAQPGQNVTWNITVSNIGAGTANNIVINDTMPNQLEIISTSATFGTVTQTGQSISFSIPSLGPGSSATATIVTRVRANVSVPFSISNAAVLFNASNIEDDDGNPADVIDGVFSGAAFGFAAGANVNANAAFGLGRISARATVLSVSQLPATGTSENGVTLFIWLMGFVAVGVIGVFRRSG